MRPGVRPLIYVSHPRNGGTELAIQVGQMLASALNCDVYFPTTSRHDAVLAQNDIQAMAQADIMLAVLSRASAMQVVPRHVIHTELREFSNRRSSPDLIVVRAEPCPLPAAAQAARLTVAAGEGKTVDEVVGQIVEGVLGRLGFQRSKRLTENLHAYLKRIQDEHGAWSARYTELRARVSETTGPRTSLVTDTIATAELDALLKLVAVPLAAELDPAWSGVDYRVRRAGDIREILYASTQLALIGEPGSGKTTTLRSLAADLATQALNGDGEPPVPVLLRLADLTSVDIELAVNDALSPAALADLEGRDLWLMLDGLNETAAATAEATLAWIHANVGTRVIVTCRRAEFQRYRSRLPIAELLPLEVTTIPTFLQRWGLSASDASRLFWSLAGTEMARIWQKWDATGETFEHFWTLPSAEVSSAFRSTDNFDDNAYNAMRRGMIEEGRLPGLLDVVRSPFLLTLTVAIFNRLHELPTRKAELFHNYVNALINRAVDRSVDIGALRQVLAMLARSMNESSTTSLDESWLETTSWRGTHSLQDLIRLGVKASIVHHAGRRVSFSHQLLQDYFAAYYLADLIAAGEPASRIWSDDRQRWWAPSIWDEAAVILAGLIGYDDQIRSEIGSPWEVVGWLTPINPILGWRCVEENGLDPSHPRALVLRRPTRGVRAAPRARLLLPLEGVREAHRGGVGVGDDGIPDIEWNEIAEGEFVFGHDSIRHLDTYWISRFPVTNRQFDAFLGNGDARHWDGFPQDKATHEQPAFGGSFNPRDRVNWYEATAFARWLESKLSELGDSRLRSGEYQVRLPTEEEWEKAARGTDGSLYPWGNDFDPTRCNTLETGLRRTSPVGIFPDGASPYGVEEMSGNVWEWCWDKYHTANGTRISHINRGGSCFRDRHRATTVYRGDCLPGYHSSGRGFRLVISARLT
jgi:hypothetical protein